MANTTANAAECFESAMGWPERGDTAAALAHLQLGLLADPTNGHAWANRGNLLLRGGQAFEALVSLERAISLMPDAWELRVNRAAALADLGQDAEAMAECDRAMAISPTHSLVLGERANLLYRAGRYSEAARSYAAALNGADGFLAAHADEYHLYRGMALLAAGDYREGWREYEWRLNSPKTRQLPWPQWNGESGRVVLVTNEQGLGDALQFMRLAQTLKSRHGGKVYLEIRAPLARIARSMAGLDGVFAFGDPLPEDIEFTVSAMSLPHRLHLDTEADIPSRPYLTAPPGHWGERVRETFGTRPVVGLCWAGQARSDVATAQIDARRSTKLAQWEPILRIPDHGFVSLQVGKEASQAFGWPMANWSCDLDDFHDTAALIACLDLVIAVDTSVAHLAGAMGKPTWLLSRFDNCWRWLGDRTDSPWYPSLRQYRQSAPGDWAGVIDRVARDVALSQPLAIAS